MFNGGEAVQREQTEVDWDAEAAEKIGYDHYMLKEITSCPHALLQALTGRVDEVKGNVEFEADLPKEYLNSLEEIQIVAAGTSYRADLYGQEFFEELAEVRVTPRIASEYEFRAGRDSWRTLVVAITQSGETAETLEAVQKANAAGVRMLSVINTG